MIQKFNLSLEIPQFFTETCLELQGNYSSRLLWVYRARSQSEILGIESQICLGKCNSLDSNYNHSLLHRLSNKEVLLLFTRYTVHWKSVQLTNKRFASYASQHITLPSSFRTSPDSTFRIAGIKMLQTVSIHKPHITSVAISLEIIFIFKNLYLFI